MEELWKKIEIDGFKSCYEISNLGRVKYIPTQKIRHNNFDKDGYYYLTIYYKQKRKVCRVHRLVAQAFIPNPLNKPQVNHKNGIKTDNRVDNLEWATAKENTTHAYVIGLRTFETLNIMSKNKQRPVNQIKNGEIINTFKSIKQASQKLNVSSSAIFSSCKYGWKCKGYNWNYAEIKEIKL